MIEKEILLIGLQEQLRTTEDDQVRMVLNELIYKISDGSYNVRIW